MYSNESLKSYQSVKFFTFIVNNKELINETDNPQ